MGIDPLLLFERLRPCIVEFNGIDFNSFGSTNNLVVGKIGNARRDGSKISREVAAARNENPSSQFRNKRRFLLGLEGGTRQQTEPIHPFPIDRRLHPKGNSTRHSE